MVAGEDCKWLKSQMKLAMPEWSIFGESWLSNRSGGYWEELISLKSTMVEMHEKPLAGSVASKNRAHACRPTRSLDLMRAVEVCLNYMCWCFHLFVCLFAGTLFCGVSCRGWWGMWTCCVNMSEAAPTKWYWNIESKSDEALFYIEEGVSTLITTETCQHNVHPLSTWQAAGLVLLRSSSSYAATESAWHRS